MSEESLQPPKISETDTAFGDAHLRSLEPKGMDCLRGAIFPRAQDDGRREVGCRNH